MAAPLPPTPVGLKIAQAVSPSVVVDMFHDVCCPFSKKMYDTIYEQVIPALAQRQLTGQVEFLWQSVPQPWHAQSCLMHDAVMAAALLDEGKVAAYIHGIFARQTDFFDDTTKDLSRVQIYAKLAAIGGDCGYDAAALSNLLSLDGVQSNGGLGAVTQHLKWAVKFHRTRGVHVTPTVFINGTEAGDVSSGWDVEAWMDKLTPMLGEG